jgi:hypothetical protein
MDDAPPPVQLLDSYLAVFNDILKREKGVPTKIPGSRHKCREHAAARKAAEQEAEVKEQEIRQLNRRLRRQRERNRSLESQLETTQGPQV